MRSIIAQPLEDCQTLPGYASHLAQRLSELCPETLIVPAVITGQFQDIFQQKPCLGQPNKGRNNWVCLCRGIEVMTAAGNICYTFWIGARQELAAN